MRTPPLCTGKPARTAGGLAGAASAPAHGGNTTCFFGGVQRGRILSLRTGETPCHKTLENRLLASAPVHRGKRVGCPSRAPARPVPMHRGNMPVGNGQHFSPCAIQPLCTGGNTGLEAVRVKRRLQRLAIALCRCCAPGKRRPACRCWHNRPPSQAFVRHTAFAPSPRGIPFGTALEWPGGRDAMQEGRKRPQGYFIIDCGAGNSIPAPCTLTKARKRRCRVCNRCPFPRAIARACRAR